MRGKLKDVLKLSGGEWLISFVTGENPSKLEGLTDINVEVKKFSPKRSLDANALCWAMCTDIGNAMRIPKEEVYRHAIKEVGKSSMMLMQSNAVETFMKIWGRHGTGWFAEVVDDSKKNPGCKVVLAYYGTSTYDSAEMSRVLDFLRQDMESLNLPIPISKAEEERMLKQWKA